MKKTRRDFLFQSARWATALTAIGLLRPFAALAAERNAQAFGARSMDELLAAFGATDAKESSDIDLKTPEIAENGAVVPVTVESRLPGTKSISIMVEKNPSILSARFDIPAGTDPFVSTRVKVAETSPVIALVQTDDGYYYAQKSVKVTLGGCGG